MSLLFRVPRSVFQKPFSFNLNRSFNRTFFASTFNTKNFTKMETRASSSSSSQSKDIVSIIKSEHRLVESLYAEFKDSGDAARKQKLMHEIIKELSVHAACEEMVLYPAVLKNVKKDGSKLANHSINEHREMKKALYKLDSMKVSDPECEAQLAEVMRDVTHHVGEEETELLPALAGSVSGEELISLGSSFMSHKAIAPTRPHPAAPDEYPVNVAVNSATKPLDSIRDAVRTSVDNSSSTADLQQQKSKQTTTSA